MTRNARGASSPCAVPATCSRAARTATRTREDAETARQQRKGRKENRNEELQFFASCVALCAFALIISLDNAMRRLYLQIYVTVVVSLALFMILAGFVWRQIAENAPQNPAFDIVTELAQAAVPAAGEPREAQQTA